MSATLVETRPQDFPRRFEAEACGRSIRRPPPAHPVHRAHSMSASPFHRSAGDLALARPASAQFGHDDPPSPIDRPKKVLSETAIHASTKEERRDQVDKPKGDQAGEQKHEPTKDAARKPSARLTKQPHIAVSQLAVIEAPVGHDGASETPATADPPPTANTERKLRAKSSRSSLRSLKPRTSWLMLGSRSPSPSGRKSLAEGPPLAGSPLSQPSEQVEKPSTDASTDAAGAPSAKDPAPTLQRSNTQGILKSKRPLSAFLGKSKSFGPSHPLAPPLPKSFSTDRLPSYGRHLDAPDLPPPSRRERFLLKAAATDPPAPPSTSAPRRKDELWTAFRQLDAEFAKFQAKPGPLKVALVRNILLPFLRAYAEHPSTAALRAEDLDRRAGVLNRWWLGLLDVLHGRGGPVVSGSDRPAVLDALTGLMTRPEWRAAAVPATPGTGRSFGASTPGSQSSTSLDSAGSDFLTESVLHNVRNMFVHNLRAQMAFVVDRLALRSVPASIVAFAGKAAAYAFAFCPGVADILVRLWAVPQANVRRVLDEYEVPRNARLADTAAAAARGFPPHLRPLACAGLAPLMRALRAPRAPGSVALDRIRWHGPWVGRWAGRDSDLLPGFAKAFHALSCELLPADATRLERLVAPGAVLVQAQLLAVLDGTFQRGGLPPPPEATAPENAPPVTFDEVLGADVPAAPAPAPPPPRMPPAAPRLMAENRLLRLLREFLSEGHPAPEMARGTFARAFGLLLQAATRRISVYDQHACFALCDFLEEALAILARYHGDARDPLSFLDWGFWLGVLKSMSASNHSMIDTRLYAFVYGLWGLLARDARRKRDLCEGWLLEGEYFYAHFNHWCPMVRAYYMRLLCWRVARYDGEAADVDL